MVRLKRTEFLQIVRYDGKDQVDSYIETDRAMAWARYQKLVGLAMRNLESQEMIVLKDEKGILSSFLMGGRR